MAITPVDRFLLQLPTSVPTSRTTERNLFYYSRPQRTCGRSLFISFNGDYQQWISCTIPVS